MKVVWWKQVKETVKAVWSNEDKGKDISSLSGDSSGKAAAGFAHRVTIQRWVALAH